MNVWKFGHILQTIFPLTSIITCEKQEEEVETSLKQYLSKDYNHIDASHRRDPFLKSEMYDGAASHASSSTWLNCGLAGRQNHLIEVPLVLNYWSVSSGNVWPSSRKSCDWCTEWSGSRPETVPKACAKAKTGVLGNRKTSLCVCFKLALVYLESPSLTFISTECREN